MKWRKSLYDIIEVADEQNTLSKLYDWMMMIVIVVSIIPLAVRNANELTQMLDFVTVIIFIIDYILRLLTADLKLKKGKKSFSYGNSGDVSAYGLKKGTYYVRIRAYKTRNVRVNHNYETRYYYSGWSTVKKVYVK